MENVTIQDGEVSVSEAGVLVKRNLTCRDGWIIGSVQIESIGTTSVLVHLVDDFPESLPVETAGFRRDQELEGGDITTERASIKQTVEGDSVTVDYGIKLAESVEEVELGPPEIRDVESAELPRSGIAHTDGGDPTGGPADDRSDASAPIPTGETTASGSSPGTGIQWGDDVASSTGVKRAVRKVDDEDGGAESTQTADDGRDGSTATDETEPVLGPDRAEPPESAPSSDRSEPEGERAGGSERGETTRRSVDARIDWLSARVDEFAAYTTALEELIDDHGTAPEFMERMEGDLEDLEGRLESVQEDVDSVEAAHRTATEDLHRKTDDLDQRLDEARTTLEAELEDIDDRVSDSVERIDDDLADQQAVVETHSDDIERLTEQVTEVGDELEAVRETVGAVDDQTAELAEEVHAMRDDLRSIRSDVQELTEFRDSLSNFFDGSADSERPDEQESEPDGE